jgi:hypothetical protein
MICGYARVSTDGQNVDAQMRQLRAAGARRVFRARAGEGHRRTIANDVKMGRPPKITPRQITVAAATMPESHSAKQDESTT